MTEVDMVMAGFCGGVIGTMTIIICVFIHYKLMLRDYIAATQKLKHRVNAVRMQDDIDALKLEIKDIYRELYLANEGK